MRVVWVAVIALLQGCYLFYEEADDDGDEGGICGDGVKSDVTAEWCDDGNTNPGDGCSATCSREDAINVRWELYPSVNGPAQATGCRPGVATIELASMEQNELVREFPCDDRRIGTLFVRPGILVYARMRGEDGQVVAESIPVRPSAFEAKAAFYEDAGYVHASWAFRDPRGNALPCPSGPSMVTLALVPQAGGATITETYPCGSTGLVFSPAVKEGTYTVTLASFHGTRTATGVVVRANNRVTEIALVDP